MKKTYIKPRTVCIATAPCELCQASKWNINGNAEVEEQTEITKRDWGYIYYDGQQQWKKEEDPYDVDNW